MKVFAIILLVLQSIGLLWSFISPMLEEGTERSDIVAEWLLRIIQKAPAIVFTILFICGVK